MRHFVTLLLPLLIAPTFAACGSDDPPTAPTQPTPVTITQSFSETLTVNGARTHRFTVERPGQVSAQVKALSEAVTLGVSLGTYNVASSSCTIIISRTDAVLNSTVAGTAQSTGEFCVWVNDVGKLTSSVAYTIDVTHF